ncbi:MAG: hypothetical protein L0H73_00150 [Nitrococcus sp.]|nr:hypothetical protein [Nitrococcus sp.]
MGESLLCRALVVMPNHVHGIIVLTEKNRCATVGAPLVGALNPTGIPNSRAPTRGAPTPGQARAVADGPRLAVGSVVGAYKSLTTIEFTRGVKTLGWPPFGGKLWQRNFHEHVIRDDASLNGIREYLANNPAAWAEDPENPAVKSGHGRLSPTSSPTPR